MSMCVKLIKDNDLSVVVGRYRSIAALWMVMSCTLVVGCSDSPEVRDISNEGIACLDGDVVRVNFQQCISSSCEQLVNESCTASVENDQLVVTSTAEIEKGGGRSQVCTLSCSSAVTECQVMGDSASATTLMYNGTQTEQLDCNDDFWRF